MNGKYLLYIQLILLVLMFYFANFNKIFENFVLAAFFITGALTSLWAFYNMGSSNFSPFPEPKKNAKLVQVGIYKYIRHPMYSGIILIGLSLFASNASFANFTIYAVLCYVLDQKADLEENLLTKHNSLYQNYVSKTKKFIPFIY